MQKMKLVTFRAGRVQDQGESARICGRDIKVIRLSVQGGRDVGQRFKSGLHCARTCITNESLND